jgi:hypothetical protein
MVSSLDKIMKNLIYLTAIATTASLLLPGAVRGQSVVTQSYPPQGYSATTIYIPAQQVPTTTTVNPNLYPSNEAYIQTSPSYRGRSYRQRYRQSSQPTVIVRPNLNYPRAVRSQCTTTIIGSPITSPVAIDRSTGQPCQ